MNIKLLVFDFDGVFTDNKVYVHEDGTESVRCSRADGLGIKLLKKLDKIKIIVLTAEKNKVVDSRCKKLGIDCYKEFDNKLEKLKTIVGGMNLTMKEVAYVGNDVNDIECMKAVGESIAVADAFPKVKKAAKFVTTNKGGEDVVREICDRYIERIENGD